MHMTKIIQVGTIRRIIEEAVAMRQVIRLTGSFRIKKMSKSVFLFILATGLISVLIGATLAWFYDVGVSRDNFLSAGVWTRDVAVTSVVPTATLAYRGYNRTVYASVKNEGTVTETFPVTCYCNSSVLGTPQSVISLGPNEVRTVSFTWNTTGASYGYYIISTNASAVTDETDLADNSKTAPNVVMLTIPGDVNGDRTVNVFDILKIKYHRSGPPPGPGGYDPNVDINSDGKIDVLDILIAKAHLGQSW